jgi:DNA replication protein DnaC
MDPNDMTGSRLIKRAFQGAMGYKLIAAFLSSSGYHKARGFSLLWTGPLGGGKTALPVFCGNAVKDAANFVRT